MPSGGARPHSGPRQDPSAIRRGAADRGPEQASDGWVHLPHAGRTGRVPAWPLPGKPDAWVAKQWRQHWRLPQALMWERQRQEIEVALYLERLHQSLVDPDKVTLGTLVRQQQQALGLSDPGLHMNRWKIDAPVALPAATSSTPAPAAAPGAASLKGRLSVVPDAAAGE